MSTDLVAKVKEAAVKAGLVDADLVAITSLDGLSLDGNGNVVGIDKFLNEWRSKKPHFFPSATTTHIGRKPTPATPADRGVRDLERADYEKAKRLAIRGRY